MMNLFERKSYESEMLGSAWLTLEEHKKYLCKYDSETGNWTKEPEDDESAEKIEIINNIQRRIEKLL